MHTYLYLQRQGKREKQGLVNSDSIKKLGIDKR